MKKTQFDTLMLAITGLDTKLSTKIDDVDARLNAKIDTQGVSLRAEMKTGFSVVNQRIDQVKTKLDVTDHERRIKNLEGLRA